MGICGSCRFDQFFLAFESQYSDNSLRSLQQEGYFVNAEVGLERIDSCLGFCNYLAGRFVEIADLDEN